MQKIENWQWLEFEELPSTNDKAKELAEQGSNGELWVVTAKRQTAGRGRLGRAWKGFEGNLFMSLAMPADWTKLNIYVFISSLTLFNIINRLKSNINVKLELKWPNDVLLNGAKISGILLEKAARDYLIVGVGVNVKVSPELAETPYPTTNLAACGFDIDRLELLRYYLAEWNHNLTIWREQGVAAIKNMWLQNAKGLNEEIAVNLGKRIEKGVFVGVDDNGALRLKQGDKEIKIMAGDIWFNED